MMKHTYGASHLNTTKTCETTPVIHLSRYIRRSFRKISNFRKTQQFLLMTENEEEPCRQKEDIETMGSYDFLTEYQQVPTMRSCEIRSLEAHCDKTFPVSKASKPLPLPPSETTEGYETFLVSKASKRLPLPPSETTERYEAFAASKANEGLPLPTSDTTEGYVLLSCKGSSNECPLPTLAATDDYDHLATNGISKKPTLPSPRSRGLATNDIQGHARLRETAIWDWRRKNLTLF